MEFRREVYHDEDRNKWIVRSSCVIEGVTHSLQLAWDEKPTQQQAKTDHMFLEEKLNLSAFMKMTGVNHVPLN